MRHGELRRSLIRVARATARYSPNWASLWAALWVVVSAAPLLVWSNSAGAKAAEPATAIVGVTIIHPERAPDKAVAGDSTVIIVGGRIQAVGPGSTTAVPAGAVIVDGHGKWLVPGLIDSHVHFFQSGNLYTRPDAANFTRWRPYQAEVARNQARLPVTFKIWLASGVTSVVDVGGPFWNFNVRDAARRTNAAPRVAVAGPLLSTIDDPPLDLGDPPIIKVGSSDAARALVRRELERKPDFIKMWFIYSKGDDLPAHEAIAKTAADTAHAGSVRFAVHATELIVAKAALRAGADYLVHSVEDAPVDADFIALAKRRHALYCPTLFVSMGYDYALSGTWKPTEAEQRLADPEILAAMQDLSRIPPDLIPERVRRQINAHAPEQKPLVAMRNLRKVWDAGIPVVMGTDAGNIGTVHGPSIFREMALMREAGLTSLEVLRSATVNGAMALGMQRELGTIAPGKLADLVVLDADPLQDVANLSRVNRVFKDGQSFVPAELMGSIR